MSRDVTLWLEDILEAGETIQNYLQGYDQVASNLTEELSMQSHATLRLLEKPLSRFLKMY